MISRSSSLICGVSSLAVCVKTATLKTSPLMIPPARSRGIFNNGLAGALLLNFVTKQLVANSNCLKFVLLQLVGCAKTKRVSNLTAPVSPPDPPSCSGFTSPTLQRVLAWRRSSSNGAGLLLKTINND